MTLSRREVLKAGGWGAVATFFPSVREAAGQEPPAARSAALDSRYLAHGLDLLCSAHATDAFYSGHAGGAVISAWFLCKEETLEPGTVAVIQNALDAHYPPAPGPFPEEAPIADGVARLLETMEEGIEELCRDGHDVIFLSLALRALHELPRAATPARIAALRRTLRSLAPRRSGTSGIEIPDASEELAEFVLEEFLGSTEGGPGQGYSGHVLTHGRALLDLKALGHEAFARKCANAFGLALETARPRAPRRHYSEARAKVKFLRPDRKAYWEHRVAAGDLELGHLFKYPYGFFGLRRRSRNEALNAVCTDHSHRLFRSG